MRAIFILFIILGSCTNHKQRTEKLETSPELNSVVSNNGSLSVKGTKIVNAKGNVVSFAGNSLFWSNDYYKGNSFYNKNVIKWLKEDWQSSIIRIPLTADPDIHDSYIFDQRTNEEKLTTVIDAALDLGLYVIIDWHSHKAEINEGEAIAFFEKMAKKYGKYPNVIYEIYNEPLKVSWDDIIKPYAEKVIAAIRKIDSDNIIVVGTPKWSQEVDMVAENPIKGYDNIVYTLHFYAGSHHDWLMNKAKKALDNGIALMVTEWGTVNADGSGDVDVESTRKWMNFLKDNHITHCNWSINNKEEGASALNPGASIKGNWTDEDLTESGKLAKSYIKKWGN
jgi:endoglucanase/cellulose 1,4-beta-cellobiosidase